MGSVELLTLTHTGIEYQPPPTATVHGLFFDSPRDGYLTPTTWTNIFLVETASEGGCTLWTYDPGACPEGCDYDTFCASDGTCVSWPAFASVGSVTVTGLETPAPVTLAHDSYSDFYYNAQQLPVPLFTPASTITAEASGSALPAFEVAVSGVAPLEIGFPGPLLLKDDQDAVVTWSPVESPGRVRLVVHSANQCHGCPVLARLVCDAPDAGSLTIPKSLVAQLPAIGAYEICVGQECPFAWLERYRAITFPLGAGVAEVRAASRVLFLVSHEP